MFRNRVEMFGFRVAGAFHFSFRLSVCSRPERAEGAVLLRARADRDLESVARASMASAEQGPGAGASVLGTFKEWFAMADQQRTGMITGGDAVQFFTRSGLHKTVLAQVW